MYKCPECKSTKGVCVSAEMSIQLNLDESGNTVDYEKGDISYDECSEAICNQCGIVAELRDFTGESVSDPA